jgi:DNA-binding NarL/FixJ family response regulator
MQAIIKNNEYIIDPVENNGLFMRTTSRGKRVFIVEDNEMHSMMIDYLISKENQFQIFKFKSGEECLKKLKMNPDIVILDYGLPGMNGMETFSAIKKYNSGIPVVVITENRNAHLAQEFLNAGVYEYILKENNAFFRLNSVLNSLLRSISEKEYKTQNNITLMLVGGFLMVIVIASVLSYLFIKH